MVHDGKPIPTAYVQVSILYIYCITHSCGPNWLVKRNHACWFSVTQLINILTYPKTLNRLHSAVVEIRVRNWSAVFEDRTFCRLLIAIPLKMLKLVGKWTTVISSTVVHSLYLISRQHYRIIISLFSTLLPSTASTTLLSLPLHYYPPLVFTKVLHQLQVDMYHLNKVPQ